MPTIVLLTMRHGNDTLDSSLTLTTNASNRVTNVDCVNKTSRRMIFTIYDGANLLQGSIVLAAGVTAALALPTGSRPLFTTGTAVRPGDGVSYTWVTSPLYRCEIVP